jgi:hypothetical protein
MRLDGEFTEHAEERRRPAGTNSLERRAGNQGILPNKPTTRPYDRRFASNSIELSASFHARQDLGGRLPGTSSGI